MVRSCVDQPDLIGRLGHIVATDFIPRTNQMGVLDRTARVRVLIRLLSYSPDFNQPLLVFDLDELATTTEERANVMKGLTDAQPS